VSRVVAVVQARMGSSRFPGKVLSEIRPGLTVVDSVFQRISRSGLIDEIVFAIPDSTEDDVLENHLVTLGVRVIRGSVHDVQSRFIVAGQASNADFLVRITADCPLIDPQLVDAVISDALAGNFDYYSNVSPPTFPDGLDVEVIRYQSLVRSRTMSQDPSSLEHVTSHLRESGQFGRGNFENSTDYSHLRWTIDYREDLVKLQESLPKDFLDLGWVGILEQSSTLMLESGLTRNEGGRLNSGQKVWQRAKDVIPGGGMLLSKRPEMFLPDQWPTYYSRAKGIEVEDLDGRKYQDFATMSVGACSLGYGNEAVDSAVIRAVQDGVMSTLNSPGEVKLAEKLVQLHPWADMVRFARSGGEANAISIRIARASTKKDKVAVCGYHGWHDWYLAANLGETSALDGHLLPGLDPAGVPRVLAGTTVPFPYNDADALESLLITGEFAAVQMEVSRNFGPAEGFLQRVRDLCDRYGVILIFDECTSGFRETFGGLHLKFGVNPDIAMFGKALGNGYAITAVVGIAKVMQSAQSTFISSTFWTERLGPEAALATLEEMERLRSWEVLPENGREVKQIWKEELQSLGLPFAIAGLDALPTFSLNLENWLTLKTLFIQEMLQRGFLSTSGFYSSIAHDEESRLLFREAFRQAMTVVSENLDENKAKLLLKGPIVQSGFSRLN